MEKRIERAQKLLSIGHIAEAEKIFHEEIQKGNNFANYFLAIIKLQKGEYKNANDLIDKIKKNSLYDKEFYNNCGLIKKLNSKINEAEKFFIKAMTIDYSYMPAILNLGELYLKEERAIDALNLYKVLINKKIESWEIYYNFISILFLSKKYEESVKISKIAVGKYLDNKKIRAKHIDLLIYNNSKNDINERDTSAIVLSDLGQKAPRQPVSMEFPIGINTTMVN